MWIISVDLRLVLVEHMNKNSIIMASEIAHQTQGSTQNISRALKEFWDKGLIECLTPAKTTWKICYYRPWKSGYGKNGK